MTLGSFLDDSHFFVKSRLVDRTCQGLWDLWLTSTSFDNLAGTETNFDKSFFFANSNKLHSAVEDAMVRVSESLLLEGVSSFKLVGSTIAAHGKPCVKQRNKRVNTGCSRLHKLRYAPVRFKHRLRMSAASPLPCAFFGTELQDLTQGQKTQLRTAVSNESPRWGYGYGDELRCRGVPTLKMKPRPWNVKTLKPEPKPRCRWIRWRCP